MGCRSCRAVGFVLAVLGTGALPAVASGATVRAQADTYVSAAAPRATHGTDARLLANRSPERRAYLRFRLPAGAIERATLRVFSLATHPQGFKVRRVSSAAWSERRVTYESIPDALGAAVRSRPLRRRAWTEVDVTPLVTHERRLAFALTAGSRPAVVLASREREPLGPRLVIAQPQLPPPFALPPAPPPAAVPAIAASPTPTPAPTPTPTPEPEYLTQVAAPAEGSSDPTYFASNHRIAMTAGGRELVVHGRHAQGVQLAWRDPGGAWRSTSLLSGTGTGDWPASIAVAPDPDGVEHAWVVWGRATMGTARPVQLVRLSGLDSPDGPVVGTPVTVDPGDQGGAVRPDLGFETGPDGRPRGVLTWVRRVASNSSELVAAWFTNLDTDTPAITGPAVLDQGTGRKGGTIVEAPDGVRIVAFAGTDRLSLIAHDPAMTWQPAQEGAAVQAYPTATVLDDGQILAAAESAAGVIVQQFSASGAPGPVELTLTGCTTPTIATDGERAWLVVVCDGRVVSRERAPDFSWSVSDRLEIGPEGGGGYAFPNALRRVEDRLRLVVRGPDGAPNGGRAAVLAYERPL